VLADAVLGDPRAGHPVAAFGTVAGWLEGRMWADSRRVGALYVGALVGGVVGAGALAERAARDRPVLHAGLTALATWAVLGGTSLAAEGSAMAASLREGDVDAGRARLSHLCGRDPAALDADGLARAALESVAENTADAVVASLVWGAAAGVPGLLGHRAVNTLDAMVGHRSARYTRFGWAAARLDDVVAVVPARLAALVTVACAPLVGGRSGDAWRVWRRDAPAHPSPNAGPVEASFAGALGLRLGGRTVYPYGVQERPRLGDGRPPVVADLPRAVHLSRLVSAVTAVLAVVAVLAGQRRP
jgi:adenosylcobinamide-phosphate synthase